MTLDKGKVLVAFGRSMSHQAKETVNPLRRISKVESGLGALLLI